MLCTFRLSECFWRRIRPRRISERRIDKLPEFSHLRCKHCPESSH